ncbi:MAG: cell division protein FtsL [Burkholderiales bacterium]
MFATRLNILLLLVLIGCALSVVTTQHKARKLFSALQNEKELTKQIDTEWGQLQLELSTWATHARVENIATKSLHMRVPEPARVRIVTPLRDDNKAGSQ